MSNPYSNSQDATDITQLKFNLKEIYATDNFNEDGKNILAALNYVAKTSCEIGGKTINWADIGSEPTAGTVNERTALQGRYNNFIKMTAGSAKSVRILIEQLKTVVKGKELDTENAMANAIVTNCNYALTTYLGTNEKFPETQNLPDGVAKVNWDGKSNAFVFVSANKVTIEGTTTASNLIDYTKITFPAELAYFASSPIKTSQDEITAVNSLPDYNKWVTGTGAWTDFGTIVENRTRFVALEKPLQYGTACLKSTFQCSNANLADNASNAKFGYKNDNQITVPDGGFKVTGILIGGQPQGVGWDFTPTVSTTEFKYTIYDKEISSKANVKDKVALTPNYTLVLDNKDGDNKNTVYITIELENNSNVDFYGAEDVIPAGSKFYLIGKLNPNETGTNITKPAGVDRVFVKDHTTVANFTITNLKNAYNHIPDMRTSKINVGLAVDLSWQDGITFNVDL